MKKYLSISIASILVLIAPANTKAQLYVTAAVGGVPTVSGATVETFDESSPSILTLSGSANLVTGWPYLFGGGAPFNSAPPIFSGSQAAFFGEPTTSIGGFSNDYDGSRYVAVAVGGSAKLSFPTPENYFGILVGSLDAADTLTFYDSVNNVIGSVSGAIVPGAPINPDPAHADSTLYVNITSTTAFSSVVATFNSAAFEFDDVAYALVVPEPASSVLFGAGLCILGLASRRKFVKSGGI